MSVLLTPSTGNLLLPGQGMSRFFRGRIVVGKTVPYLLGSGSGWSGAVRLESAFTLGKGGGHQHRAMATFIHRPFWGAQSSSRRP